MGAPPPRSPRSNRGSVKATRDDSWLNFPKLVSLYESWDSNGNGTLSFAFEKPRSFIIPSLWKRIFAFITRRSIPAKSIRLSTTLSRYDALGQRALWKLITPDDTIILVKDEFTEKSLRIGQKITSRFTDRIYLDPSLVKEMYERLYPRSRHRIHTFHPSFLLDYYHSFVWKPRREPEAMIKISPPSV